MTNRILLFSLFLADLAFAAPVYNAPARVAKSQSHFTFELSHSGVGKFMDHLEVKDKDSYAKVKDDYSSLRSSYITGQSVAWIGLLAGIGMIAAGGSQGSESGANLMFAGMGVSLVCPLVGWWLIVPSQSDYIDFINKYNQLKPNDPVDVSKRRIRKPELQANVLVWNF